MSFISKQLGSEQQEDVSLTGEASSWLLRLIAACYVVLSVIGSLVIWQKFGQTSLFPSHAERFTSSVVTVIAIATTMQGIVVSGLLFVVADIGENVREIRKKLQRSVNSAEPK